MTSYRLVEIAPGEIVDGSIECLYIEGNNFICHIEVGLQPPESVRFVFDAYHKELKKFLPPDSKYILIPMIDGKPQMRIFKLDVGPQARYENLERKSVLLAEAAERARKDL